MIYRRTLDATTYVFADLRDLLAKATPPRSGDRLAGIAADSAEQMIAARIALADVPLKQFLHEAVIPYEDDEITRLIVDSHGDLRPEHIWPEPPVRIIDCLEFNAELRAIARRARSRAR